ncbi:MAG: murein biosynthesis integral membrane protein MurJ [Parcubacteria group bacterium]|jgi:putative peptidoglycan lipid II flippase|nr:murein biosynthesis integral membrane protein MurJ [Parcubacteria group bacterium]|tara:strand:- start:15445 stop:17007 length:1563 start_codon:yes stop_codon:yes gene_type:complete
MIKRLFNNQSKTIMSAAFVLGAASLVSRLLGLVRDRMLAGMFGAGDELDIYYAAFRIPDLVFSLLVVGAISAGFIPVFINYVQKNESKAWHLANSVLNLITLSLVIVCLILIIIAPWLIKLIAPGFSPDKLALTVQLTRIMFLSPFFLGLSAVLGGILQSFRRFLIYALGPIMYNLGIIFGVLFLVDYFGLKGLAYGVVLGAFLHMVIQVPSAWLCGFKWRPVFDFRFAGVKRVFKMMPPRIINLAFWQITLIVMTVLASLLAVGSVAVYNLAYNIWSFPLGIFGISFVVAAFPKLSQAAQKKNKVGFVKIFSSTTRQILFFTLPAAVLFIVLRSQIVQIILGTGRFETADVHLTAQILGYFSLGLFAQALILLFLRGFFAWEDAKTPLLTGFLTTLVALSSAWFLAQVLGVVGLALAFSLSCFFHLILLTVFLRNKIGWLDLKKILISSLKMLLACLIAGLAVWFVLRLINQPALIQGGIAGLIGVLIYFFLAWIFRLEELNIFFSSLVSKLPWKKVRE